MVGTPTVIFVCVHNAGRSQMAAAFLRERAQGRVRALSAGTEPGERVHPEVVTAMRELGIDIASERPQRLTPELAAGADRLISMGCAVEEACPALGVPMEDWALEDPGGKPLERVREIRDEIGRRVDALAAELLHEHHHHATGIGRLIPAALRPHSHDAADSIDATLLASSEGMMALKVSLAALALTAALQLVVVLSSHSVALFADTVHNFADALTAIPLGIAFMVGRRVPNRRHTYGYGRAEDLAGILILVAVAVSSAIAAWSAIDRLMHPRAVENLGWVVVAGLVGFAGNELVAVYRIRIGRRIGSAALVADGLHARTDGLTSLAVVGGALGGLAGWTLADPIVGLAITVAILFVLKSAARDIYRRLMDAVDPALVEQIEREASAVDGVQAVEQVRVRWVGHELRGELSIVVDQDLPVARAHDIAETVHHQLLHHIPRLTTAVIHVDPCGHTGGDPHDLTSHHAALAGDGDGAAPSSSRQVGHL